MTGKWWIVLVPAVLFGQSAPPAPEVRDKPLSPREKQAESIRKQRESVRKQAGAAKEDSGWFTLPWPKDDEWRIAPVEPVAPAASPTDNNLPPVATKTSFARPVCDPVTSIELDAVIGKAATEQNLPVGRLRDIIRRESAFDPCAVSPKGAMGLMQLMPGTARDLGVADAFDPSENVNAGARFLRQLLNRYGGDWRLALGAYNAGPAAVDAAKDVPPFAETQDYVKALLNQ